LFGVNNRFAHNQRHSRRTRSCQVHAADWIFYRYWLCELQTPDDAYIFGATNLPSDSVLRVTCSDFIGQGSHIVSKDTKVTVAQNGLFQVSVAPKQSYKFKSNMICDVAFHAWDQPAAVLKLTGRHGEKLGKRGIKLEFIPGGNIWRR
jgi:hypothetical protein